MSPDARQLCRAAYESTFRAVSGALGAHDPLQVAAGAARHVEQTVEGFRQLTGAAIDCRAGCSFCCWLRIDARAHEVLLIARFLKNETATTPHPGGLEARIQAAAEKVAGLSYDERQAMQQPCALLDHAGCCSVYEARPLACRRYLSVSVEACSAIWQGEPPEVEPEHPMIAEPGRYAANGAHNAFIAQGYDGYQYELMAALREALADPECEARWRLKQPAFSEAARSSTPAGFSQDEALAQLRAALAAQAEKTGKTA